MNPNRVRGWNPPRSYKRPSDAKNDLRLALTRIAEGVAILEGVAKSLNETEVGSGDLLHGIHAAIMGTMSDVKAVLPDVEKTLNGEEAKSYRANKMIRLARTQSSDRKVRREIRKRQRKTSRKSNRTTS